jgi:hypothetical protein
MIDTSVHTMIDLTFLHSDRFQWKSLEADAELAILMRLIGKRWMPMRETCRLGVEFSVETIRDWLENPNQWRAIQSRPNSEWSGQLFPLPLNDPVIQQAIGAMRETIQRIQSALDAWRSVGWQESSAQAVAWHMKLEDQLEALKIRIGFHPPRAPMGRRKGSKKPHQQQRSQNQEQLEKLMEAIRSWYAIHESYPTIPQAMQQMGWWADPKRVWDLLHAFNRPPWRKFVRQVVPR